MLPTLSNLLRRKFGRHYTDYLRYTVEHLADGWGRAWARDPVEETTLLHGDYHPKELFFSRDAARRVVATDWQATCLGSPGIDLHRVLLAGLDSEQMRDHQERLQTLYHESLTAHGVSLDHEALVDDTRRSMLLAVRNWLFSVAFTDNDILERSAGSAGVDYRERIFEDFSRALELNRIHELFGG
jgi:aminoglycoside phosphotransferase (APT) family kinase protein